MRSYETTLETSEELEGVNEVLASIGEPPVSTLEGDANADVANARRILNTVNRQIQSKGWTYNIEEIDLVPDVFSKLIPYMSDYLRVFNDSGATQYINRGGYLYDTTNKTDQFTSSVTVSIIRLKEFNEMPECFRSYIIAKASRQFNMQFFGATEIDAFLQERELECWRDVQTYELDYGNFNMLDGDSFVGGLLSR